MFSFFTTRLSTSRHKRGGGGGGGGRTPTNSLYEEGPPERGTFFRLQVYDRVEILLFEVYGRVGRSVIWVCERAQRAEQMNFIAV